MREWPKPNKLRKAVNGDSPIVEVSAAIVKEFVSVGSNGAEAAEEESGDDGKKQKIWKHSADHCSPSNGHFKPWLNVDDDDDSFELCIHKNVLFFLLALLFL